VDQEAPEYLTWQSADRARTVRFEHGVIRRIHIEIMRGYGVTRRRGTEPGGILLGSTAENGDLLVEGVEIVPCEYAFGPSFLLSAHDEAEFAAAVEKAGPKAIGYFRSHTRDGLSLDQADADIFSKYLAASGRVALLLKPFATKSPAASLFFPVDGGRLRTGEPPHEFVFSTKINSVVAEPDPVPEPPPPPAPPPPPRALVPHYRPNDKILTGVLGLRSASVPAPALEEEPRPASPARKQRDFLTLVVAILFTAAALGTGFVTGFQMAGGHISLTPPSISGPDAGAVYTLGLRAQTHGERVRIQWSTRSTPARLALGGTLYIRDGNDTRVVNLQPGEVRDGMVLHLPQALSVRFRLELNLPADRTVSEAVEWKR